METSGYFRNNFTMKFLAIAASAVALAVADVAAVPWAITDSSHALHKEHAPAKIKKTLRAGGNEGKGGSLVPTSGAPKRLPTVFPKSVSLLPKTALPKRVPLLRKTIPASFISTADDFNIDDIANFGVKGDELRHS